MNTTQTLQQMQQLRLQGMYQAYKSQLELPMDQQLKIPGMLTMRSGDVDHPLSVGAPAL
jgi:hypothetical protein